jgi:DNA polymerase III delta prime subunit
MDTDTSSFSFVPLSISKNTLRENTELHLQNTLEQKSETKTETETDIFSYSPDVLEIHLGIKQRLNAFYQNNKIPHIIFHGPSGGGKMTLVFDFIHMIYQNDKTKIKNNVMIVNCSHGKGIKFIRDELKFFAKANVATKNGLFFKTILLINANHLTIDAQSALRRCIELFSYNTRFFIVVENKNKLLNPIQSRFCEIYVPEYREKSNSHSLNLHQYHIHPSMRFEEQKVQHQHIISQMLLEKDTYSHERLADIANDLYDRGVSCLELMKFVEENGRWTSIQKSQIQMCFYKIKSEFRNEKLLMFYMLDFMYCSDFILPDT